MILDEQRWPGPDQYEPEFLVVGTALHSFVNQFATPGLPAPKFLVSHQLKIHLRASAQKMADSIGALQDDMEKFEKAMEAFITPEDPPAQECMAGPPKPPNKGPRSGSAFARNGKKRF
jgi:hypothetical protein